MFLKLQLIVDGATEKGATILSITTVGKMTLNIMTFSITINLT